MFVVGLEDLSTSSPAPSLTVVGIHIVVPNSAVIAVVKIQLWELKVIMIAKLASSMGCWSLTRHLQVPEDVLQNGTPSTLWFTFP